MTIERLAEELRARDNFLLLTHVRPDGDTMGSATALCHALGQLGKTAYIAPNEEMTCRYEPFASGLLAPPGFKEEATLAVDIADESLLPLSQRCFTGKIDFCIDHHPSNKLFAVHSFVRSDASATGEIVWQLVHLLGAQPCEQMMAALYLAVATDTGCFRYLNTTSLSHIIAAEAIAAGVDIHAINLEFFSKKTKARFAVEKALLDDLHFECGGKIAGACLTREFIEKVGATEDDLENLSGIIINLEGLLCGVLAVENKYGESKLSVRTRAPLNASQICEEFGGGGHARAAGCTLGSDVGAARDTLLSAAVRALEGAHV